MNSVCDLSGYQEKKKKTPQGAFKPKLYFCICDYIEWMQEQATDCHLKLS